MPVDATLARLVAAQAAQPAAPARPRQEIDTSWDLNRGADSDELGEEASEEYESSDAD
jgi:hypothetical protein